MFLKIKIERCYH